MTQWIAFLLLQATPLELVENPGSWFSIANYPNAATHRNGRFTIAALRRATRCG